MVINRSYLVAPNTKEVVYEYQTRDNTAIFESGFFTFLGDTDIQCMVYFYLGGKPKSLWLDHPVPLHKVIPRNSKLKFEIVNGSADTHVINLNLFIRED